MENGIKYLKENWLLVLFYLVLFSWVISIAFETWGLLILASTVILVLIFEYLSKKVFKLHKKGPIPWYGSPIIWVGGIVFAAWIYWCAIHT